MAIPDKIPALTPYQQALNSYNPEVYPAHKKITAEEWNALLLSGFAQGNRQEDYLNQIINGHLPDVITTLNAAIEALDNHELRIIVLEALSENNQERITAAENRLLAVESGKVDKAMDLLKLAEATVLVDELGRPFEDESGRYFVPEYVDRWAREQILILKEGN